jgi:hypothetical protein
LLDYSQDLKNNYGRLFDSQGQASDSFSSQELISLYLRMFLTAGITLKAVEYNHEFTFFKARATVSDIELSKRRNGQKTFAKGYSLIIFKRALSLYNLKIR